MKLVTEQDLRAQIGARDVRRYVVDRGTIVTPSARQYLSDRKIELVVEDPVAEEASGRSRGVSGSLNGVVGSSEALGGPRFVGPDGGAFTQKPEHMTHLHGNRLVSKGHPVIAFRGKLDSLQAEVIALQALAFEEGNQELAESLEDFLGVIRSILRAEVTGSPVEELPLLGFDWDTLRGMSHDPRKAFGRGHIRPHYSMGRICAGLNLLRVRAREAELAAFRAFYREDQGLLRQDIVRALNRLSSAFYVAMYINLPAGYDKEY
ncbi:ethanolamine utilization cobalamin adenosyltransferase [Thermanaerovibrio velox DSM 12556]|uniref:Ethanolamine utilization cobalamin adenosyltransferase n=1 Tax=Thermanaerovibrio velox DSM 12556 TaxID=926567 RepID=H0UQ77_9BACT|nr:cobalamin adenosyltransferase [Thermanaerovibrio velox]EHM10715.1 ethanolamine utilization cobalamin adenosyltransferase [Thermanaerovibrio velox DSM 12556]